MNTKTQPLYSSRVGIALQCAAKWHECQARLDGLPYFSSHLLTVTGYVSKCTDDEDTIIGAVLHDAIEDAGVSLQEIQELFGEVVAHIVKCLTEDKSLPKPERKSKYVESIGNPITPGSAVLISMWDKYDSMVNGYRHQPDLITPEVITFNKELLSVYKERMNKIPNKGVIPYSYTLGQMENMIEEMVEIMRAYNTPM